jgi:hypothetical protein
VSYVVKSPNKPPPINTGTLPAPLGGINSNDPLANMDPNDCIYIYNLIPMLNGLHVRDGYVEWRTGVAGTGGVRTLISVKSQDPTGGSQDHLFACTSAGIYDVTSSGTAPALVVTFGITANNAGYGHWFEYTTTSLQYIIYLDEENGMYTYQVNTATWLKVIQGAGANQILNVNPANFVHGVSYKGTLFLVEKNSSRCWYLAVDALYGPATKFELGNKFLKGGPLVGAYIYMVNGSVGPQKFIVFLSSVGDVSLWTGTNPGVTDWTSAGSFYAGDLPAGRRVANSNQFNGDLLIISIYGVIQVSNLIAGMTINDRKVMFTDKISALINQQIFQTRNQQGWEIVAHPKENLIIINSPLLAGSSYIQFIQNVATQGWAIFRGIPYLCSAVYNGELYFGTLDNRVCVHRGDVDNESLAGTGSTAINWSMLTAYLKSTPNQKIPSFVRAYFSAANTPAWDAQTVYDYNITENPSTVPNTSPSGSVWNVGLWDAAVWGGNLTAANDIRGTAGIGVNVAVALRGSSISPTTFLGFETAYRQGGFM